MNRNRNNYVFETEQDDWIRVFDLPGVMENITESPCGGQGTCGKCRFIVLQGECTPPGEEEKYWLSRAELEQGIRLACHCLIKGKIQIEFFEKAAPQILTAVQQSDFSDPVICNETIKLSSGETDRPLLQQLQELSGKAVDSEGLLSVLRVLGETKEDDSLTITIHNNKINGISNSSSARNLYGMAVDLGTTSVAGSLFHLDTGREMHTSARLNPQCAFGLDIMSRISYASRAGGTEQLQRCILDCLDEITAENCARSGIEAAELQEIVITGNTVMLHLLAGVNPSAMGHYPYRPVFTSGVRLSAGDLGLTAATNAAVFLMPSSSAFIGADITAGIIATGLDQETDHTLLLDLGTNGEMALFSNDRLWACSVAAGPALEGMNIECGMRAEEGAVDRVWMENNQICLHSIGERSARGVCGSGLIEAAAMLIKYGIVSANGRMLSGSSLNECPAWSERIAETEKGRRFWLVQPSAQEKGLYISQQDIRQLQLAKGAISAGIRILLNTAAIEAREVRKINLAGALGNYINPDLLIELGFFPAEWRGRIRPAGNAALQGAGMALRSLSARVRADQTASKIRSLNLTACQEFQDLFIRYMSFG